MEAGVHLRLIQDNLGHNSPKTTAIYTHPLALASHGAVFGLFAILDGASRIDDEATPVDFQLWYEGKEGRKLLSGDLHDLLNSENWYR